MPLSNINSYLAESSPATDFLKEALKVNDILLLTDTHRREAFIEAKNMLESLEQTYHTVILDETDKRKEVEEVLKQFTKDDPPPHLFYKQKYLTSGRGIEYAYEKGEIEQLLGLPPVVVQ